MSNIVSTCTVVQNGVSVVFESSRDLASDFEKLRLKLLFRHLIIERSSASSAYVVRYVESNEIRISYHGTVVQVLAPWDQVRGGETLLYASLPLVECQLQLLNRVTVHAASVAFSEGAVLLLGKEGSGKTTTAIELCRKFDGRLIGNDLVALGLNSVDGRLWVFDGTKYLHLRYESIRRNLPELLHVFSLNDQDPWLCKVIIDSGVVDVLVAESGSPLIASYVVHVDSMQSDLFLGNADRLVTRLFLNENFSRYIRGGCISLLGSGLDYLGYVPSYDTEQLFLMRQRLIEGILQDPPMRYVSGNVQDVSTYIHSRSGKGGV